MIVMPSLTHGRWAGMIVDMVAKAAPLQEVHQEVAAHLKVPEAQEGA